MMYIAAKTLKSHILQPSFIESSLNTAAYNKAAVFLCSTRKVHFPSCSSIYDHISITYALIYKSLCIKAISVPVIQIRAPPPYFLLMLPI